MFKRVSWVVLGIVIVLPVVAGIVSVKVLQFKTMGDAFAQMVIPPEPVNAIEVRNEEWHPRVSAVGSVEAVQGTVISAESSGIVREILFEAGSTVNKDEVLVRFDLEVEQAQLRAAEATAELTRLSYTRAKDLIGKRSISQAELDSANARLKEAEAQVDHIQAIIAKKTIRAPFTGKLGIRRISVGQYLDQGSPIVPLHTLDPVYVEFSLPQQRLNQVSEGLKVVVASDSHPGQLFEGTISAVNPHVDPATRNVRIQATLTNVGDKLRPGMFVSVDLIQLRPEKFLIIPATAVLHGPTGNSVFVVEEGEADANGNKPLIVHQKVVRLGTRMGDFVAVIEGLQAGERIVSTGVFKLQPGMQVVIDNTLAPEFTLTPSPRNT